ncbi:MAG: Wzz/FepE/Etk N-terminal domain-containing protein, partial [Candidatus Hodarchaeota archaeon]
MNYKEERKELDLMEYWKIILKRKWVIVIFAGTLIFFTGVFSFLAAPKYKSTTTLLIEEETSRIFNIEDTFGYQPGIYRDMRFYNTQLRLLESKSLAERVARKMNLLSRPEYSDGKDQKRGLVAS